MEEKDAMNTTTELAVIDVKPQELTRRATDVAGLCKEIVVKTAVQIQGRKYVRAEGWLSIATAHGCIASSRDVEKVQGGYRAVGEIRRINDGALLATAEGFVGEDEPTWFGGVSGNKTLPKRPEYAIRAMCQTRAISRVCRAAFAHVVVMMDAGLSTTPAEEVPEGGFTDAPQDTSESFETASPAKPPQKFSQTPKNAPTATQGAGKGNREENPNGIPDGQVVMFEDYSATNGQSRRGPWTKYQCTFATDSGSTFKATTFDEIIGTKLDTLKGNEVVIKTTPNMKNPNYTDLVSIDLYQEMPTP